MDELKPSAARSIVETLENVTDRYTSALLQLANQLDHVAGVVARQEREMAELRDELLAVSQRAPLHDAWGREVDPDGVPVDDEPPHGSFREER